MSGIDSMKINLIDRILSTSNEQLLETLSNIFESSKLDESVILSDEQIIMLEMSNQDIKSGRLISEHDLQKTDSEWMN